METLGSVEIYVAMFISICGLLCIYLSYSLLKIGTTQTFGIFSDLKGWKFKTANIAPSLFFAILGSVMICSPVISNIISILQKETFINTYATRLILDELRKKNQEVLSYKLEDSVSLENSGKKFSSSGGDVALTKPQQSNKAVVTVDRLRLRKKPGTNHQVITSLPRGQVITIKETGGSWLRVSTDEFGDGWVHGNYVKKLQNAEVSDSAKTALLLSPNT